MKLTVCFGDTKVVVPCGSGDISIRDLAFSSLKRVRNTLPKLGPHDRVVVHSVTIARDGGILDWDDLVRDVLDDRELVIAHYSIATLAVENAAENSGVLPAETASGLLFHNSCAPLVVDLCSDSGAGGSIQSGSRSTEANKIGKNGISSSAVPPTAAHFASLGAGQPSSPPRVTGQHDLSPDGLIINDGSTTVSSSSLSLSVSSGSCCVPAQSGWTTGLSMCNLDPVVHEHRDSTSPCANIREFTGEGHSLAYPHSGRSTNGDSTTAPEVDVATMGPTELVNCSRTLPKLWQKTFPPTSFELLPAVLSRRRDCLAINWDSGDEDDLDGEEDVDMGMYVDNEFEAAFDSGILYSPSRRKTRTILEQPVSTVVSSVDDSMIQHVESNPSVFGHANVLCKIESFSPHLYPDPETLSTPVDVWPLPAPPPQFDDPTQVPRMHVDIKMNRVIPIDVPGNALDDSNTSHLCMCGSSFPHSLDSSLSESEKCANKRERSSLSGSLTPILQNCLQSTSACMCSEVNHFTTSIITTNTTSCACSVATGISSAPLATAPVTPAVLPIDPDETMVNPVVETHVSEAWASNSADIPPVLLNVNRFGGGFSCGPPVPTIPEVEEEEEDEVDDGEEVVLSPEESKNESVSGDCSKVTKMLKVTLVKCKRNKDLKGLSESTGSVVHTTQPQAAISPSLAPPHIQSHSTRRTKTEQNQSLVGENEEPEIEEDYPLLRPDYFVGHDRPDACSFVTCGLERQRALDRMANCDKFESGLQRDFHVAVGEINSPTNERQSHIPALTGSDHPALLRWLESTQVAVTIPRKDFSESSSSGSHDAAGSSGDSNTNTTTLNAGGDLSILSNQSTLTIHEQTVDVEETENSSVTKNQPAQPKTVLVQLTNTIPGENLGIQIKPVFTDRAELVAQGFRVSDGCRVESGLEVHHVMPNGRVAREGFLAAGDRILSIDGVSLIGVPFEHGRDMFQAALKKPKLKLQIQRKAARSDFDKTEKKKSALPSCRLFIISDTSDKAKEAETLSSGRTISKPAPPPPPRRSPNTVLTRIPTGIVPPLIEELLREENRTGDQTGQSVKDIAPVLPPKGDEKSRSSSTFLMPPPSDCLSIQLKKGSNGLGFSLTSRELALNSPFSCGTERVVCVKNILPDGAALLDGRLRSGDRLIQVDGLDVTKLGQANTVSLLREKPVNSVVNLTIWRSKGPESSDNRSSGLQDSNVLAHITSHSGLEKRSVRSLCHENATNSGKQSFIPTSPAHLPVNQLYKLYAIDPIQYNLLHLHIHLPHTPTLTTSNTVAGLTANSGRTSLLSSDQTALSSVHPVTLGVSVSVRPLTNQPFVVNHHPKDASNNAVFVRTVIEGGPAYLDGRLEVGDRLLTIDGEALSGIAPSDAVNKLKTVIARDMVENRPHVCLLIARSRNASAVTDEPGAGPKRETTRGSTKPHAAASNTKDSSGRIESGDSTDPRTTAMIVSADVHPHDGGSMKTTQAQRNLVRSKVGKASTTKLHDNVAELQTTRNMHTMMVEEMKLPKAKLNRGPNSRKHMVNDVLDVPKKSVSREINSGRRDRSQSQPPISLPHTQMNKLYEGCSSSTQASEINRRSSGYFDFSERIGGAAITIPMRDTPTEDNISQNNRSNKNNNNIAQTISAHSSGSTKTEHVYRCDSQGTISSAEMPENETRLSDCSVIAGPIVRTDLRAPSPTSFTSTSSASTSKDGKDGVVVLSDPETDRYSSMNQRRCHRPIPGEDGTQTLRANIRHQSSRYRPPCRMIIRQPVIDLSQMVLVPFDAEAWSGPVLKPRWALTTSERAQLVDSHITSLPDAASSFDKKTRGSDDLLSRNRRLFSRKTGNKSRNRCDSTPSSCVTGNNFTTSGQASSIQERSNKILMLTYDSDSGASHQSDGWTSEAGQSTKKSTVMNKLLGLIKSGTQQRSIHSDVSESTLGMHVSKGTWTQQKPCQSNSYVVTSIEIGDPAATHTSSEHTRFVPPLSADMEEEGRSNPSESNVSGSVLKDTVCSAQTQLSEYFSVNDRPLNKYHVYHQAREAQSQTGPLSQPPIKNVATCMTSSTFSTLLNPVDQKPRTQTYADLSFTDYATGSGVCVRLADNPPRISSHTVEVQTKLTKSTVNRLYDADVSSCSTAYESVVEFLTPAEDSASPSLKTSREVYEDAEALYRCLADLKQSTACDEDNVAMAESHDQIKQETTIYPNTSK